MSYQKKTTEGIRGRPKQITPQKIELALTLREKGFSIAEIANAIGVSEALLYFKGTEWDKLRQELNAIKAKKEQEQINAVSRALYKRAVGQKIKVEKEAVTKNGEIVTLHEVREIAGDVKAQQFYLANRDPNNWSLQPDETQSQEGKGDGKIKIEIVEG